MRVYILLRVLIISMIYVSHGHSQTIMDKLGLYVAPGVAIVPVSNNLNQYSVAENAFGGFGPGFSINACLLYYLSDRIAFGLDGQYFLTSKPQHILYNTSFGPILKYNFSSSQNSVSPFVMGGPRFGYTYLNRSEHRRSDKPATSSDLQLVDIKQLDLHFGQVQFGIPCFGATLGAGIDFKVNKRLKVFVMASYTYQFEKGNNYIKENFPGNKSNLSFITGEVGVQFKLKNSKPKKNINSLTASQAEHRRQQTMKKIAQGAAKKDVTQKMPAHQAATHQPMKFQKLSKEGLDPNKKYVVNGQVDGATGKNVNDLSVLILDESGKIVAQSKVDKNGRFAYKGLKADNYTLSLNREDPSLKATANMMPEDPNMKVDANALNKFAYNRLSAGGKPAGVILGDAKLNDNGQIAAEEPMLLIDGKGNIAASTQTDKNGRYAFRNLKTDNYQVIAANNPTVKAMAIASTGDPNLQIDEEAFKKFESKKLANGSSPEPVLTGKINTGGYIKDARDQSVLLLDKNGTVVAETKASKEGRFAFRGLHAENYQAVLASGDPNVTAKASLSSTDPSMKMSESAFSKFGKIGNQGTIEKFVVGNVGLIGNQLNSPNATALLVDDNGNVVDAAKIGKEGNFVFKNVRAANYQVVVEGADYDKLVFDVAKNDVANSSLSASAFKNYEFTKLNTDGTPQNVVIGKVDLGGQQLTNDGTSVLLLDENGSIVEKANTDKEGHFAFRNVRAANYQAVVEGQDYQKVVMEVASGNNAPQITAADFVKHFPRLTGQAVLPNNNQMIAGKLTAADGTKIEADQSVFLIDGKGAIVGKTVTKKDGSFTFDGLHADNYQTVLEKPSPTVKANMAPVIKDPEMKISIKDVLKYNPETKKLETLTREDHVVITGTLRSDDFMAVENRTVLLLDDQGQIVKEVYSDKSGVFRFSGIKAKEYQVAYQDGDKKANPTMQMYRDNDPSITEQGGKIATTMFYDHNQIELSQKDKNDLEKFVQYYKEHPNLKMIKLNAYGDATGTDEANLHITQKRAQMVMDYLKEHGIPGDKVKLNPMGKSLKFKNKYNQPDGKLNRKVDVEIIE